MYYEVNSQAEENALTLANGDIVVRLDLLPVTPTPNQPVIAYQLTPETSFASAYLTAPDSNDLDFGTGDFEIRFDFKLTTLNNGAHQFIMSKGTSLNNAWYITYESLAGANLGHIWVTTSNNNTAINFASGITNIDEYHTLKVKRVNGTTTAYLDDVEKGTTTLPLVDTTGTLYIGAWNYTPNSHRFTGSLKNVVITKG